MDLRRSLAPAAQATALTSAVLLTPSTAWAVGRPRWPLPASGLVLGGRPRGLLRAMMAPWCKISPPQTPHGSARSSASDRQAVRSGHCWQRTLACSSSSGSSENHISPPPRWQGSRSASVAGGGTDPALEALGMTILRPWVAPVRLCTVGTRDGTGRVGAAGELLGAHNVVVAWICRQRLERPTGWTMVLADTDLLHRDSFPRGVCRPPGAAPMRSGRRCCSSATGNDLCQRAISAARRTSAA
jgi:hypothetical protein